MTSARTLRQDFSGDARRTATDNRRLVARYDDTYLEFAICTDPCCQAATPPYLGWQTASAQRNKVAADVRWQDAAWVGVGDYIHAVAPYGVQPIIPSATQAQIARNLAVYPSRFAPDVGATVAQDAPTDVPPCQSSLTPTETIMDTPTLDGMTVEQLDDIITRATATKKQVAAAAAAAEEKEWVRFTPEWGEYRIHKSTFAVHVNKGDCGWASSISFSDDMQKIKKMATRNKYILAALTALNPQD